MRKKKPPAIDLVVGSTWMLAASECERLGLNPFVHAVSLDHAALRLIGTRKKRVHEVHHPDDINPRWARFHDEMKIYEAVQVELEV